MRLIDADALIGEMHNIILEAGEDRRVFYSVIERQPTIEEPQWIPCSERLPDKPCRCLTTNDAWGAFKVDWNAWIDGQWLYPNDKPVAWMPLPEPWRGDAE